MTVIDYMSLKNAYNEMTTILMKHIHCGDEDERKHINKVTLGEVADFVSSVSVQKCVICNGKGICYYSTSDTDVEHKEEIRNCPACGGSGGDFVIPEIDCTL